MNASNSVRDDAPARRNSLPPLAVSFFAVFHGTPTTAAATTPGLRRWWLANLVSPLFKCVRTNPLYFGFDRRVTMHARAPLVARVVDDYVRQNRFVADLTVDRGERCGV